MGQIIQPLGPVIGQVLIEMDAKGTTKVSANHIVLGKQIPMGPLDLCSILSQLVSSTLQVLANQRRKVNAESEEKTNHDS